MRVCAPLVGSHEGVCSIGGDHMRVCAQISGTAEDREAKR